MFYRKCLIFLWYKHLSLTVRIGKSRKAKYGWFDSRFKKRSINIIHMLRLYVSFSVNYRVWWLFYSAYDKKLNFFWSGLIVKSSIKIFWKTFLFQNFTLVLCLTFLPYFFLQYFTDIVVAFFVGKVSEINMVTCVTYFSCYFIRN